jgi:Immunity protein 50
MAVPEELTGIVGAKELHDWFGYWPSFHDGEIISLHLNRTNPSTLKIHCWHMTDEVDEAGYYVLTKHAIVEFLIDISGTDDCLELFGFSHQNVVSSLAIEKLESGYKLNISQCYGLAGTIKSDNVSIRLTPGKPES